MGRGYKIREYEHEKKIPSEGTTQLTDSIATNVQSLICFPTEFIRYPLCMHEYQLRLKNTKLNWVSKRAVSCKAKMFCFTCSATFNVIIRANYSFVWPLIAVREQTNESPMTSSDSSWTHYPASAPGLWWICIIPIIIPRVQIDCRVTSEEFSVERKEANNV